MTKTSTLHTKTLNLILIAMMAALMAVCSWISIPAAEAPFTLQTFAVFTAVGLLGGKRGTCAVLVYILLGAVGLPVFAGFTGGPGRLLGTTGGYIVGFLFSALIMWCTEKLLGSKLPALIIAMVLGLITCYAFGTAWFVLVYTSTKGAVGIMTALGWCVFPYIIPDLIKIALAALITAKLRPHVPA